MRKNRVSDALGSESEEECHPVHVPHSQDDITDLSDNTSGGNSSARLNNKFKMWKRLRIQMFFLLIF